MTVFAQRSRASSRNFSVDGRQSRPATLKLPIGCRAQGAERKSRGGGRRGQLAIGARRNGFASPCGRGARGLAEDLSEDWGLAGWLRKTRADRVRRRVERCAVRVHKWLREMWSVAVGNRGQLGLVERGGFEVSRGVHKRAGNAQVFHADSGSWCGSSRCASCCGAKSWRRAHRFSPHASGFYKMTTNQS